MATSSLAFFPLPSILLNPGSFCNSSIPQPYRFLASIDPDRGEQSQSISHPCIGNDYTGVPAVDLVSLGNSWPSIAGAARINPSMAIRLPSRKCQRLTFACLLSSVKSRRHPPRAHESTYLITHPGEDLVGGFLVRHRTSSSRSELSRYSQRKGHSHQAPFAPAEA